MAKEEVKKYPMTIRKHLDRVCKDIVVGHKHYRGNRNQFYIEAIELAVVRELGEEALKPSWYDTPKSNSTNQTVPSDGQAADTPSSPPVQSESPEVPPKESEPAMVPQSAPSTPQGRTPLLEWRDGAIRNQANEIYELTYGPPLLSGETKEQQFERCKRIKGVIFERVTKENLGPEANTKLVVESAAQFD